MGHPVICRGSHLFYRQPAVKKIAGTSSTAHRYLYVRSQVFSLCAFSNTAAADRLCAVTAGNAPAGVARQQGAHPLDQ